MRETENSGENEENMDSKHRRVYASAVAGLRQVFLNDRNGEILLYVTFPCILLPRLGCVKLL